MNDANSIEPAIPAGTSRKPVPAAVMLVVVTFLWGLSFPLTKYWQNRVQACPGGDILTSVTLIAVRTALAFLIFGLFRPRLLIAPTLREHSFGFIIGVANFTGFALQVVGLSTTTPALTAFLTSLSSAWVPVIVFVLFRSTLPAVTLLGLILGIGGTAVLGLEGDEGWTFNTGAWLSFLSSILFAVEILLLDRLGRRGRPGHLTAGFMIGTWLPAMLLGAAWAWTGAGIALWATWTIDMLSDPASLGDIILLTIFCSVLTSHWLVIYQPRVPAGRAVLIYLLEPVFAAMISMVLGHDQLTIYLIVGGTLILLGNLLAELPTWWREFNRQRTMQP